MGYYTQYFGELEITPPLTRPEHLRLAQIVPFLNSEEITKSAQADVFDVGLPALRAEDAELKRKLAAAYSSLSFLLMPGCLRPPEDGIKAYCDQEVLPDVAHWLARNGHALTGAVTWEGEDCRDSGTIYAAQIDGQNRVEFVEDVHDNPGPTWAPTDTKD